MTVKKIVILGLGLRGKIYADYAFLHKDEFLLTAIIDTDAKKLQYASKRYGIKNLFSNYQDFLEAKIEADIVAITTQDYLHEEHSISMMENGYDILLEKPISNTLESCLNIFEVSKKLDRKVIICHVLRYTAFYNEIKRIIREGILGDIITISCSENVGFSHQAHSFVRGPWRNKQMSSPMILSKCCHDMDILYWLADSKCRQVNSIGDLKYFVKENAPCGSADFCSDCGIKNCIYNAQDFYTSDKTDPNFKFYISSENDDILGKLKHSLYDRCVYKCDNDVVDHQNTIMKFFNGITAVHTMTAFSKHCYRDIKIHGTKADLYGNTNENKLHIGKYNQEDIITDLNGCKNICEGHGGGDFYLMHDLFLFLNGIENDHFTDIKDSIESHLMAFKAEESRLRGGNTILLHTNEDIN
jgi:predicted dehydrogenase